MLSGSADKFVSVSQKELLMEMIDDLADGINTSMTLI